MSTPLPAARRWLPRAGLVAAAAGVSAGVVGCAAAPPPDAPSSLRSVVLPAAPAAPSGALLPLPADSAPPRPLPASARRNPFVPLHTSEAVPVHTPEAAGEPGTGGLTRVLRRGSRGNDVRLVQQALVEHRWPLAVDGIYGARTTSAVIGFQRARGLVRDGLVGPLTWAALQQPPGG